MSRKWAELQRVYNGACLGKGRDKEDIWCGVSRKGAELKRISDVAYLGKGRG